MADTTALCCFGSGFNTKHQICVNHLHEAYEIAQATGDKELAAIILAKHLGRI